MGAIFLSYAREDRGCAEKLARVLETAGHEVWWDRRLDGGEEFSAEIEAALDKSDVVLVAWSKESVRSRWVRDEAAVGGDTGRLVPVSIDGSLPPMGFRQFHTLDLTDWRGAKRDERTAELLHSVERRLSSKGKDTEPAPRMLKANRRFVFQPGKLLRAVAAMLVIVVAVGGGLMFQNFRKTQNAPLKPTMALLPFTTASPDSELRTLGSQARDSLAHTFSQSGVPLRVLNAVPQDARHAADFLISGDLSRNGDKVVATIRLDEAAHGVTVYSRQLEASREDVRDLPERIGAQTAARLTANDTMMMLDRRHPLDPALMADLLGGDYLDDPLQAYQIAKRTAAKAPNAQYTQLGMAFETAFALSDLPREERDEAVAEARRAADRAIALGPKFGDAYAPWCALHSETLKVLCEDRLRAARRVDPDAPWLNTFLSHLLRGVGRADEAMDLARLSYTHDVYVPQKIAWMLRMFEYAGESDEARKLHQQGARWWPEYKPMFFRNRLFGLIDRGDLDAIQQLEREVGVTKLMPSYQDSAALVSALKSKSIVGARQACPATASELLNLRCMLALASLGDQDGAYAIADKLYPRRVGRTPAETERIWLDEPDGAGGLEFVTSPAAAPMRRDPRYLQLAERVGLLAYWRSGRPPDFCRKQHEPICAQLLKRN
jgi:TolB-like protein